METLIQMVKVGGLIVAILLLASIAYAIVATFIKSIKDRKTHKEFTKNMSNLFTELLDEIAKEAEEEAKKTTKKSTKKTTRKPRKAKEDE